MLSVSKICSNIQISSVVVISFLLTRAWSLTGQCKNRCDNHRHYGDKSSFTFNCSASYGTDWEIKYCQSNCVTCPSYVCDTRYPDIFHCPSIEIKGQCQENCEKNREKGYKDEYFFNCGQKYHNNHNHYNHSHTDLDKCQNDCSSCPDFVCNPGADKNLYFCPSTVVNRECKQQCVNNQPIISGVSFSFNCSTSYSSQSDVKRCQDECSTCPSSICDEGVNSDQYFCPAEQNICKRAKKI